MADGGADPLSGHGFHVSRDEFEAMIDAAWQELPPQIRGRLGNVLISAADDERERAHRNLYGLYEGVPEPNNLGQFPARITLWQRTMEHDFPTPELLAAQVRVTLLHEIGHHFGMSEAEVRRATYGEG